MAYKIKTGASGFSSPCSKFNFESILFRGYFCVESRSPVGRRSFDEDEEEQDKKVVSGKRPSMKSSEKIRSPSESPKRSISRTKSYERDSFDKKEEEKGRGKLMVS